ncbi:hypothetical protein [Bifidobacterium scaligerum]|uniref:Periplasmic binding protein domain-containing protein n=1 Tax=Bifidobacterium scaligerum TaxID=2052656 RepID=A0A2M9HTG8_9BIFI|nr:hypothetical protein [Bifidobacterium scaligerum]PJM80078.1 hypothetical protein CUU80_02845 [Bifidobacterium scaligerum]
MVSARRPFTVLIAVLASCATLLSLTACVSGSDAGDIKGNSSTVTSSSAGSVALFTPSDGITLNQQTPLNKWAKLVPDLTKALVEAGMEKGNISHKTSDSLDKQSRAIQDFVVNHLSETGSSNDSKITIAPENMTLLVAPVVKSDASTRQYGDYVSQELTTNDTSEEGTDNDNNATSHESGEVDGGATTSDDEQSQAADRLVSSLKLAQESGMHVILLGNSITGYEPDAFVKFSDAQTIGKIQAEKVKAKLELDKASKDNPKQIEVLLPYETKDDNGKAADTTFAQEAFQGVWSVLGAYYQKGVIESPSGALDADSTQDDWQNVAYDASQDNAVADTLKKRLAAKSSASLTRIDAIIAMNDSVASDVVTTLDDMGYTGSAADINPQITISGIVGNITGKKDLSRQAVPDPIKSPEKDKAGTETDGSNTDESTASKDRDSRWPLVTGYGAYVSVIPSIVNGKQWITGLEDRQALASDIAQACTLLNTGSTLKSMSVVHNTTVAGVKKIPTISEPTIAVSASNLKAELIDPGYISLADAGL